MSEARLRTEVIVAQYRADVEMLTAYIPWLEKKAGQDVVSVYDGKEVNLQSVTFPVYDATLMNLVNQLSKTVFMDRNYHYIYSGKRIKTVADERRAIEQADIRSMHVLGGILSKYVIGGMTKGALWTQAVKHRIFLYAIKKAKELIEFHEGCKME